MLLGSLLHSSCFVEVQLDGLHARIHASTIAQVVEQAGTDGLCLWVIHAGVARTILLAHQSSNVSNIERQAILGMTCVLLGNTHDIVGVDTELDGHIFQRMQNAVLGGIVITLLQLEAGINVGTSILVGKEDCVKSNRQYPPCCSGHCSTPRWLFRTPSHRSRR